MPLEPQRDDPAALIAAILGHDTTTLDEAAAGLVREFGPLRARSPSYDFVAFSSYYEAEMGAALIKQLLWFEAPLEAHQLAMAKGQTLDLERQLARDEGGVLKRRVNIDPGLVSRDSLVLATTKPSGHRVGIGPGLYAEITLLYERGEYRPMPWTYRDFRSELAQTFLKQIREHLLATR